MNWPAVSWAEVPVASADLMRQADAQAHDRFGIEPRQLMEVAGFQFARFVDAWLGAADGRRIAVVAGSGNNGGDALVAARFLSQRGAIVRCFCLPPRDTTTLVFDHANTLRAMGISCEPLTEALDLSADLILDGLLGTGIRLPLREPMPELIRSMNQSHISIISIDLPSGLDSESGEGDSSAVQARATLTLGLPKPALASARACGRVFLADIGLPPEVFEASEDAIRALYRKGDLLELLRSDQSAS